MQEIASAPKQTTISLSSEENYEFEQHPKQQKCIKQSNENENAQRSSQLIVNSEGSQQMGKQPNNKKLKTQIDKYRVRSRVKTNVDNYSNEKDKYVSVSKIQKLESHNINKTRTRSFLTQKESLQKQLQQLMIKKQRLDNFRVQKKNLRTKLLKLQDELKEIKVNHVIEQLSKSQKNKHTHPKLAAKLTRLKPLRPKKPPLQADQALIDRMMEQRMESYKKHENKDGTSDEQQVGDFYYEAQLNHKCLNCKNFHIKIQDVRIPVEVKNDFNL